MFFRLPNSVNKTRPEVLNIKYKYKVGSKINFISYKLHKLLLRKLKIFV
jgi:hypothetical protein